MKPNKPQQPQPIANSTLLKPVVTIHALSAEAVVPSRFGIADQSDQLYPHEDLPAQAIMVPLDPAQPEESDSDIDSMGVLTTDGIPEVYATTLDAQERIRYLVSAKQRGAMLTLAGLEALVGQLIAQGAKRTTPICIPDQTGNPLTLIRMGGAHLIRLNSQHVRADQPIEEAKVRDIIVFDCGVLPPLA